MTARGARWAIMVICAGWGAYASAQTTVTEAEVVQRVLERIESSVLTGAEAEVAEAEGISKGVWDNPEIDYERESIFDAGIEQTLTLSQDIPLGGQAGLWRRAGERRAAAARIRGRVRDADTAAGVRRVFYLALAAQRRVELQEVWLSRVESGRGLVEARLLAGDASALDAMRAQRELRRARVARDRALAEQGATHAQLESLLGQGIALRGTVMPPSGREPASLASVPSVQALDADLKAVEIDLEAAGRSWIPSAGLRLGVRRAEMDSDVAHGVVVGASISVPIFDQVHPSSAQLRSERARIRASKERAVVKLESAWRSQAARALRLRTAAETFLSESGESDRLVQTAEAGYAGGELDLWQLLDHYRAQREDDQTHLALEMDTRMAEIELDRLAGRVQ